MGGDSSKVKIIGEIEKNPVRVKSAEHGISEWDVMGDKNYSYYSGMRFTKIDSSFYAKSICDTHPQGSWWLWPPHPASLSIEPGGEEPLLGSNIMKHNVISPETPPA